MVSPPPSPRPDRVASVPALCRLLCRLLSLCVGGVLSIAARCRSALHPAGRANRRSDTLLALRSAPQRLLKSAPYRQLHTAAGPHGCPGRRPVPTPRQGLAVEAGFPPGREEVAGGSEESRCGARRSAGGLCYQAAGLSHVVAFGAVPSLLLSRRRCSRDRGCLSAAVECRCR